MLEGRQQFQAQEAQLGREEGGQGEAEQWESGDVLYPWGRWVNVLHFDELAGRVGGQKGRGGEGILQTRRVQRG